VQYSMEMDLVGDIRSSFRAYSTVVPERLLKRGMKWRKALFRGIKVRLEAKA